MSKDNNAGSTPDSTAKETPAVMHPKTHASASAAAPAPAPASTQGARRNLAQPLAVAALLVAVGTIVGGYFIWHEVQRQGNWQEQVVGQIDGRSQALEQRLQSFKDRLDSDLASTERVRRSIEEEQRQLANAQQGLEDSLGVLRAQLGNSRSDWMLAEVQYLLQVANQRIQLDRDVLTTRAALSSADRRLQTLADPGFNGVREQIARELVELDGVVLPDLAGIALTLDTLASQVNQLPLKDAQVHHQTSAPTETATTTTEPTTTDWTRLPRMVWQELRSLVVVRRNDAPVGPMLAPEQQFFLYENLRLQLNSARLAALQGESESYRASLRTAQRWLGEHFDNEAPQIAAARAELERLACIDLRPALPDISASLRLLRQQMHLDDLSEPGKPAAAKREATP
ncbi:MAG: uroporphyrinogen-III C-methyltransferase [Gammaproteobacteria bacterium]|nr:uroporphyrinogen-III C-methyltransferase [Gammaproteobacteria bacterium]MBU2478202.1 uroporphyrinogen-III C-methyltransferase [Gammaproteobacteria bacterium]